MTAFASSDNSPTLSKKSSMSQKQEDHDNLTGTDNTPREAASELNLQMEGISEICDRSAPPSNKKAMSSQDVLLGAINFLSSEFGFDKNTCEDTRSRSTLLKMKEDRKANKNAGDKQDLSNYE
jgi:hypothetical protein